MRNILNFGRWTTLKSVLAVGAATVVAGAVGTAVAISPIVNAPVKWAGGAEIYSAVGATTLVYTVPAGKNLMLTDVVVSNFNAALGQFNLYIGDASCASVTQYRLRFVAVPASGATALSLGTGIGFLAGQRLCASSPGMRLQLNARGFLFTPAPVS